jgi:hypothetical protein
LEPPLLQLVLRRRAFEKQLTSPERISYATSPQQLSSMSPKKSRSDSVGPKLTIKDVASNPLLVPLPPDGLPKGAQQEWLKAQVALRNLEMTPGLSGLNKLALQQGSLLLKDKPNTHQHAKANQKAKGDSWWKWLSWGVKAAWPKASGTLLVLLLLGVLLSGQHGPITQLSRLLGSVATLSEAAAFTGAGVFNATGSVASSVSSLALAAVWQSMKLSESAWRGVDILDVVAQRCDGHVAVDGSMVLRFWLNSTPVQTMAPCLLGPMHLRLLEAAQAISQDVPSFSLEVQEVNVSGSYGLMKIAARMASSGHLVLDYTMVNITFQAEWSNPVWSSLELPLRSEQSQVLSHLQAVENSLPVKIHTLSDAALAHLAPFSTRMWTQWERHMRGWRLWFTHLLQLLGLDTLRGCGALALFFQTILLIWYRFAFWQQHLVAAGFPFPALT